MCAARRRLRTLAAVAVALLASACATIPPDAGRDPVDPLERVNRHVFEFNDRVDRAVLKPVAQGYVAVVPEPVRGCVTNFFANLGDVANAANNLLQGKPAAAVSDICRIAINTTVGVLGCFDVASKMGLEKHNEDFGQTLGRWGVGNGAYLVVPVFGPRTVRDAFGRLIDVEADPVRHIGHVPTRNTVLVVRAVNDRANLLDTVRIMEEAALDKYIFVRDSYLQRRRSLIYDGNPPREPSSGLGGAALPENQSRNTGSIPERAVAEAPAPDPSPAGEQASKFPVMVPEPSLAAGSGGL